MEDIEVREERQEYRSTIDFWWSHWHHVGMITELISLRRVLRAMKELRENKLPGTADLLQERVLRAYPTASLQTNPLDGHISLWGQDGIIAGSEEPLDKF